VLSKKDASIAVTPIAIPTGAERERLQRVAAHRDAQERTLIEQKQLRDRETKKQERLASLVQLSKDKKARNGGSAVLNADGTTTFTDGTVTESKRSRIGEWKGHKCSSLCVWMGKNGWTYPEAAPVIAKLGYTATDSTIKTGVTDGRGGKYGKPAALSPEETKELESMRPKIVATAAPASPKKQATHKPTKKQPEPKKIIKPTKIKRK
jgi:hypothetical protein